MASRLGAGSAAYRVGGFVGGQVFSHLLPLVWACVARRTSRLGPPRLPPVSRPAAPQLCGRKQAFTRPPLRRMAPTRPIPLEAAISSAPPRRRTLVLQPTPRRAGGSLAHLFRERRIRGPTHSETTCSPAYPPFSRISPGRRGCVRTRIYGVCAFASGELEHTFKMCTYVRMYVRRYVREFRG